VYSVKFGWHGIEVGEYNQPMHYDLEVSTLSMPETRDAAVFEGVPLHLADGQFVTEEASLLDAIIAAIRPLRTLVRRQSDER
jgi:hypothetical protein